ncbi:MAG: hypothetical protein ABJH98_09000 [Reichenbachiella sp.]|uniref:hypothetical protein n=1 Tax=Reichenbachiella sp. TaxID=2184521 RepID=UPI003298BDA0
MKKLEILRQSIIVLFAILLIQGCGSSSKRSEFGKKEFQLEPIADGYSIIFYKLDDFARVYLNDEMIVDTAEKFGMAPKNEVLVDLTPYLKSGIQNLKVELYNGQCVDCNLNRWAIFYEVFVGDESLEFVSEDSNDKNDDLGLKVTNTHQIDVP